MNRNTDFIPFAKPSLGKEEENAVISVLRSNWLTTGNIALEFERQFREYVGSKHAIAVNSATAGLHLSLEAVGIRRGDKVITSPFTFAATAEVVRYLDAEPLFVDIEESTGNIDVDILDKTTRKNRRIKAIIPVHFAGNPCKMDRIMDIARAHSIAVIEDSAHAFPVRTGKEDRFAGTIGEAGVFSFYVTKPITTGEGGMVVTDDDNIYGRILRMRLHGIDRDVFRRYTNRRASWMYDVVAPGYKYNLTDIAAAIGLVQLEKAKRFLERRREIARSYIKRLSPYDFLTLPRYSNESAWHLFVILLNLERISISRERFVDELLKRGIGVSVHFIPLHMMTYYRKRYSFKPEDFPASYRRYMRSISIPIYPDLSEKDVQYISQSIIDIGKRFYRPH